MDFMCKNININILNKMDKPVFVLAPDSFKGSLSALEVCEAMERGIKRVLPDVTCIKIPMADGGEGTVQSLLEGRNAEIISKRVMGPLNTPINAVYGIIDNGKTAIIEMASASGLHLVEKDAMNPAITTSYGTGELIKDCLDRGVDKIIIGIGGSATNDGGAGLAQALGVRFLDEKGEELNPGGLELLRLAKIDNSSIDKRLKQTLILAACDVTNTICGKSGASIVFAPQKGATPHMAEQLDIALEHYADVIEEQFKIEVKNLVGGGAAGGLGVALHIFAGAELRRGIEILIEHTGLRQAIKKADYIFTGEGSIDAQTQFGKTPFGIARLAREYGKEVIVLAGRIGDDIDSLYVSGVKACFCILPKAMSLDEAIQTAKQNVERTMQNVVRLIMG